MASSIRKDGSQKFKEEGWDTECLEKLQEENGKLMESLRSLLSVEVSFLFPTMAGIQHLNKLSEMGQALLLVTFLVTGYIGTVALIVSHSTNAMRWSSTVSALTMLVTTIWLGIFHTTVALLTPEPYMEAYLLVNVVLFICVVLLIGSQWKRFFRPPKAESLHVLRSHMCVNSRKKDGDRKKDGEKCLEKLQEQHNKLMEAFRSLLSSEVSFLIPAMVGISHLDRLGEVGHAAVLANFLIMGYLGTITLILSHSTDAIKWSAYVSFMTVVVTVFCLGVFHVSIAMLSPEAYRRACILVNDFLLIGGALVIGCLWHMLFPRPKS